MRRIKLTLVLLLSALLAQAQGLTKTDSIYKNASKLYEQKKITAAIQEFEKLLLLSPKHKNAMFNLAVINYELGNKEEAINLFQKCVRLGDRQAAEILKKQLGKQILYADTMHIADIEVSPKIMVNSKPENIIVNNKLNKAILEQAMVGFEKSKILREESQTTNLGLYIYVGKDGRLNAKIYERNHSQTLLDEISLILQRILIIPGKHEDKIVTASDIKVRVLLRRTGDGKFVQKWGPLSSF